MTTTQSEITEERVKVWPLSGYAPGNYHCLCIGCEKMFEGDKRAYQCLECAASSVNTALTRRSSAGVVKGLEWVDDTEGPGCPIRFAAWPLHGYRIHLYQYGEVDRWAVRFGMAGGVFLPNRGDAAAAKAAVEAEWSDYLNRAALSPQEPVTGEAVAWRAAAKQAIDDWDRQVCIHETVHRGGSIWTICDDCGRKWADDRGGFIPYSDPAGIAHLRALLDAPAPSPLPAAEGEIVVSATSILAIRDALAADDTNEAWHQLYAIADPAFCEMEPWRNLEHKAALASPSTGVNDAMVERALAAFNEAINNPQMVPCDRCDGKGYHHGFGEDGASPDWCEKCGGNQYDVVPGEESRAMRAALLAAHGEK